MTGSEESPSFRLAYVPGVTPAKWVKVWHERLPDIPLTLTQVPAAEAPELMRAGEADAGLVRLPVDRDVFSAIPLYTETSVVVVPKDHVITAADEVTLDDLADEVLFHPLDDVFDWDRPPGEAAFERPATTQDAIELVAANVGLLVVPQSLARLYHRRDLTYRPVTDAPQSGVALSWPEDATTDLVEEFIGIVRGRTVNSTRGRGAAGRPADGGAAEGRTAKPGAASAGKPQGDKKSRGAGQSGARQKPGAAKSSGGRGQRARTGGAKPAAKRGKPRKRS
ncbi:MULTISPECIES: LysR family substrate-binding domain-containing protein [unclassified Streptomyces]|uniref:LysR family substrate-binding domain-containing protein n=1 Tax=unclassified Streptomyces TaxID=2593676 RepID=UPI000DC4F92F|nr:MULTISPECIES: LysR family substrate-binding domain-containing protein [Streptomyces]RAJ59408.1 LysR substrate binding domain-containing protein [Streptomyces sp. PsTaAH-130]